MRLTLALIVMACAAAGLRAETLEYEAHLTFVSNHPEVLETLVVQPSIGMVNPVGVRRIGPEEIRQGVLDGSIRENFIDAAGRFVLSFNSEQPIEFILVRLEPPRSG